MTDLLSVAMHNSLRGRLAAHIFVAKISHHTQMILKSL